MYDDLTDLTDGLFSSPVKHVIQDESKDGGDNHHQISELQTRAGFALASLIDTECSGGP